MCRNKSRIRSCKHSMSRTLSQFPLQTSNALTNSFDLMIGVESLDYLLCLKIRKKKLWEIVELFWNSLKLSIMMINENFAEGLWNLLLSDSNQNQLFNGTGVKRVIDHIDLCEVSFSEALTRLFWGLVMTFIITSLLKNIKSHLIRITKRFYEALLIFKNSTLKLTTIASQAKQ